MTDVKWIKLAADLFDDEKILLIESRPDADALIVLWAKFLCLAGKQNNHGIFVMSNGVPYTREMLATVFRRPLETVLEAVELFIRFGMLAEKNGVISIPNWEKHQSLDALEKKREYHRDLMRRQRARQKEQAEPESLSDAESADHSDLFCDVPVTHPEKRREEEKRTEKNREEENTESAQPEGSSADAPAIPLVDKTIFVASNAEITEWQKAYPAVNVRQQLQEMRAWCLANPSLRKTRKGIKRFIVTWLSREQDKGHPGMAVKPQKERRPFVPTEL